MWTVQDIFHTKEKSKVRQALFDIYYDAWFHEFHDWNMRLDGTYSVDKEASYQGLRAV